MVARRLLIVMLVLLGISSVIAVVTPNPRQEATEKEAATGATGASGTGTTGAAGESGTTGADGTTGVSGTTGPDPEAGATGQPGNKNGAAGGKNGSTGRDRGQAGKGRPAAKSPAGSKVPGGISYRIATDADAGEGPLRLKARTGERLVLTVTTRKAGQIAIRGLGQLGFADRYAPARFDVILPERPGRFPVVEPGTNRPTAVIVAGHAG